MAEKGGRFVYFEGTYSTTFSRDAEPTPRYDYNQIMYRLDLTHPRLQSGWGKHRGRGSRPRID